MKKLLFVLVLLAFVVGGTHGDTPVDTAEKDSYVENSTKLIKANNLLKAARDAYNAAVEVENQKYKDALVVVTGNHQPGIDVLVAEIASIEASLEAIK